MYPKSLAVHNDADKMCRMIIHDQCIKKYRFYAYGRVKVTYIDLQ